MANTVEYGSSIVYVTDIDSDFTIVGQEVESVQFNPGAAGDYVAIKEDSVTGPLAFPTLAATDVVEKCKYFNGRFIDLTYDHDSSSVTAGASLIFHLKKRV